MKHAKGSIGLPASKSIPLIVNHRQREMLPVGQVKLDHDASDLTLYGEVRFSKGENGRALEADIRDGIITDVSVAAEFTSDEAEMNDDDVLVVNQWRPIEASLVTRGAIESAKVISMSEQVTKPNISAMFGAFRGIAEFEKLELNCHRDEVSEAEARTRIDALSAELAKKGSSAEDEVPQSAGRVELGADERDKFHENALAALSLRCDLIKDPSERRRVEANVAQSEINRSTSMLELAQVCMRMSNMPHRGMGKMQLFQAAIRGNGSPVMYRIENASPAYATGDFSALLSNVANKTLGSGYTEAPETWGAWTSTKSPNDFKVHSYPVLSTFEDLALVKDLQDIPFGRFGEKQETMSANRYGRLWGIGIEAMVNDDLSAVSSIPARMGRAASRVVGDKVYERLLDASTTMTETGRVLFNATDGNLGTGAALTNANLQTASTSMRLLKGPALSSMTGTTAMPGGDGEADLAAGATLGLRPRYLLVPAALEFTAREILNSTEKAGSGSTAGDRTTNVLPPLTLVDEHRLDANSSTAYYLIADAAAEIIDTIAVGFVDGMSTPFFDQQNGFEVEGVVWKIRHAFSVGALDWRGMRKETGV